MLGILFALGRTCGIGPTLAVVLTLAAAGDAWRGATLAFVHSLGMAFLLGAASAGRAMAACDWPRRKAGAPVRLGGLMLVLVGVLRVCRACGAP